jgi:hypothetical protein
MMKKVRMTLFGVLLLTAALSCKKAEKVEIEKPTNRIVSTFAGSGIEKLADGIGQQAAFKNPQKIAVDASGNMYVADQGNHCIRKITPEGLVTTFAGNGERGYADGNGASAQFNAPTGIAVDGNGNLYVADSGNHCIRKISSSGVVSTLAGMGGSGGFADGTGTAARFNYPYDVALDKSGNIFVADLNNNRIRKVTPSGVVTNFVGNGQGYFQDGTLATATMYNPASLVFDLAGNLYVGQSWFIRKITPDGTVSLFAGNTDAILGMGHIDGSGLGARFNYVYAMAIDKKGNIYAADSDNHVIRKITPDGMVSTYAGIRYLNNTPQKYKDGIASDSYFAYPQGIAIDRQGNIIVAENANNRIRKITEVPIPDSPEEITRKNWNNPVGWK